VTTTNTDLEKVAHALPAYDIGTELGRGAMGVVIAGEHRQLGRPVAIKQLPLGFGQDPTVKVRFVQEARLLASLDHPHIVPVFDFVDQDGLCLLVMEMLTGGTVWSRFTTTGLTNAEACGIVMATASALQAAHSRGILHRDIKPENLMFSAAGALKVTDFGIAAVVGGDQTLANEQGEVIGTPAYMAPEQALGQALSPATDVFAAGVLLYELLTGQLPYSADGGPVETLQRHAYDDPIPINEVAPTLPAPLAAVVMKALARRPEDRYQTAEEFGVALAEAATNSWKPGWLNPNTGRLTFGTDPLGAAAQRGTMAPSASSGNATLAPGGLAPPQAAAPTPTPTVVVGSAGGEGRRGAELDSEARPDQFVNAGRVAAGKKPLVPYLIGLAAILLAALALVAWPEKELPSGQPPAGMQINGAALTDEPPKLDLQKPLVVELPAAAAPNAGNQMKATLKLLGRSVFNADAPVVASPTGGVQMSFDFSAARFVAAGPTDLEVRLADAPSNAEPIAQARIRTDKPLLTAPVIGGILLALYAVFTLEATNRTLARRKKRSIGSLIGAGILGVLLAASFAVLVWGLMGRVPQAAGVVVAMVLGAIGGVGIAIGGVRRGRRRRAERAQARAVARATSSGTLSPPV
jgi:serine/threonine-protein kinase